jgi:transposase-like protein
VHPPDMADPPDIDHEAQIAAVLEALRWPDGFVCPSCTHHGGWKVQRGLWKCTVCHRQTSVTAGTIFAGSHTPLSSWLAAIWLVAHTRQRVNDINSLTALQLKRKVGLASYETAWRLLDKLRRVMAAEVRGDLLQRGVEVDALSFRAKRSVVDQASGPILIAVESRPGKWIHRVRMMRVPVVTESALESFVRQVVEPGTFVKTKGEYRCPGLAAAGFQHQLVNPSDSSDPAHVVMPAVTRLSVVFWRWWVRTHRGAANGPPLDHHLAEFGYYFNRRRVRNRDRLVIQLLTRAAATLPGQGRLA